MQVCYVVTFLKYIYIICRLVIYIYAARASGQKRLVELLRDTLKRVSYACSYKLCI